VTLRFDGVLQRAKGTIEIPEVQGTLAGGELSGSIKLRDMDTDPSVDLAIGVRQLEFGRLLGAAGLAVPESLGVAPGGSRDLGSANIEVRVRGRAAEPAALVVSQKINFTPPRPMPPAISRLRGDFVFRSDDGPIRHRPIDVSLSSPDFIALHDVPPLFVRTLLLSEDAGFYGHGGIDLRELPAALLTNWSRGGARRVDHHAAIGQEPVPVAGQGGRTQAAGTGDYVSARVCARQGSYPGDLPQHHRMGAGPAWPATRGPPLFRSRTAGADAGPDGLPGRNHPGADQVPAFICAWHAGAWSACADRQPAGEAEIGGSDRRRGISASAQRIHRRYRWEAARMIRSARGRHVGRRPGGGDNRLKLWTTAYS